MTPTRRKAGAAAQRAGASFEGDLLKAYRPQNVALQRTGPPWHYVKTPGGLKVVIDEDGVPDWHATVSGHAWVFESKATSGATWEVKHLEQAQAEHLDRQRQAGAVTGVLLRFDATGVVVWMSWLAFGPRWWAWWITPRAKAGTASLTPEQAASMGRVVVGLKWWSP